MSGQSAIGATFTLDQSSFLTDTASLTFGPTDDFDDLSSGDVAGPIVRGDFVIDATPGTLHVATDAATAATGSTVRPHRNNAGAPNVMTFTFNGPVNAVSFNFDGSPAFADDVVTISAGGMSIDISGATEGSDDLFVGIFDLTTSFTEVSFTFATRVGNGTFGIDDVTATAIAPVPLPATLPVALSGLALAGFVARRRRA